MKVLSVDSSTETASVALIEDDKLLGEINFNYKKQHSVLLLSMIDNLLNSLSLDMDEIDGFVISKGPGSFTGLRIGMATIKGMSLASNKPYISLSSLDALAYNMYGFSGIVCSMMDALRNNVYTSLYQYEDGNLVQILDYSAISVNELIDKLNSYNKRVCFIGDAINLHKDILEKSIPNCLFAPSHLNYVRAASLGELGMKKLKLGEKDDINNSAPIYLRKSQAEREYEKKQVSLNHE
ncbi:tRNA (adenosine(37)-N6)-threonylcarbamoyltransferase complex dimerization subunit type 1 TsaB [Clostridium sp. MSJ-4]|uniref:tRNA (Adenosine(37)-N6)-threonylcarbamoyltransferase complex dimerization subunit type 1 TsaB n=1 Tax=Clostridium simiarum TaxID=2841506 RepID=A0ABS6EVT3_9CLOT|nr:tRNA (adenosine(37)-N6)-threonylcarbamoyltransferase complex dimerization subunit type 1 TsaB [Clostridium simiarum]MBU5590342.1 tRNA (adenosine(37)-N6)-threonylcarbamoyltransferase complex dimerization subunit type 1 TsaB [Clostridium simiarum]